MLVGGKGDTEMPEKEWIGGLKSDLQGFGNKCKGWRDNIRKVGILLRCTEEGMGTAMPKQYGGERRTVNYARA